jgi:hypothetical protein
MNRIACCGLGFTLLVATAAIPASAQNQAPASSDSGSSLGDYARQVRKSSGTSTKPKVFDNDNLPTTDKLSVVGKAPAEGEPQPEAKQEENAAPANGEAKPGSDGKTPQQSSDAAKQTANKQWGDRLAGQKESIDLMTRELDVAQREYQVRAAAMYGDVGNRLRNSGDWDKQDAQYKQQIADRQKALEDAKQKLDDMEEEARKAGVPASVREP